MTPDWIPNIHPFIIHFPVALLVTAVLFDLAWFIIKKENRLNDVALALYTLGTAGLAAAFLSGRQAVETVSITGDAVPAVTSHEDWALYTLIFFCGFTILRFWTTWKGFDSRRWIGVSMLVLAFTGTGMLWKTGELGARLVFNHGVAVGELDRLQQQVETLERELAVFREESAPVVGENSSWIWRIGPGADQVLRDIFQIEGNLQFNPVLEREDGIYHLALSAEAGQSLFLFGDNMRSIDGRMELNTANFDGILMLIHHYQNPDNYQYLRLSGSSLTQGRFENGVESVLESGQINAEQWFTLRVTADGGHFYGYHDQQTITHPHADEMAPGFTGFAVSGQGTLKIRLVEFRSIN